MTQFKKDDAVFAKWTSATGGAVKEYPAHVTEVNTDRTYTIVFNDDGSVLRYQKSSVLRAMRISAGEHRRSNRQRTVNAAVTAAQVTRPKKEQTSNRGPTVVQFCEQFAARELSTSEKKAVLIQ